MKFGTLLFPLALIVATPEAHAQTIDAFSQLEDISYAQVSPDGSKVAIVRPYQGLTAVFVYDLNGAAPKVIPVPENLFVNWLNWASDEHVVITVRVTEELDTVSGLKTYTFTRDFSVNVDNGAFSMMLANNPSLGNALSLSDTVSRLSGNDNAVLMGAYRITNVRNSANSRMTARRGGNTDYKYTLFRVNLSSGSSRAIETFNFDTYSVIATETGDLVARVDHNTDTGLFEILASEGSRWRQIYSREEDAYKTLQPLTVLGLAHDSDTLMVRSFTGEGFRRFQRMATDDGSLTNAPGQPRGHDVDAPVYDPGTGRVIGYEYVDDLHRQVLLDSELEGWRQEIAATLGSENVRLVSWNSAHTRILAISETASDPGSYHLLMTDQMRMSPFGSRYPSLQGYTPALTERFDYSASDGLKINGYLTYPAGKTRADGPFPLVIMPHGGPRARDDAHFDWLAQFIASRGYAVFKPNFRGSTGYGAAFRDAGYGEFGGAMVDDMYDGVSALIEAELTEPGRVCSLGASYGGYAALALASRPGDALTCAVSINGVSDLSSLIANTVTSNGETSSTRFWELYMGDRIAQGDQYRTWSPSQNASRVHVPVLLLHSENDTTVPIRQSELMNIALRETGNEARFVRLPGDDHYLSAHDSRVAVLTEIESFLGAHLH